MEEPAMHSRVLGLIRGTQKLWHKPSLFNFERYSFFDFDGGVDGAQQLVLELVLDIPVQTDKV